MARAVECDRDVLTPEVFLLGPADTETAGANVPDVALLAREEDAPRVDLRKLMTGGEATTRGRKRTRPVCRYLESSNQVSDSGRLGRACQ